MTLKIAYQKTTSWKPTLELCDMPLLVAYKQSFLPSLLIVHNKRKIWFFLICIIYTFHDHPNKTLPISKRIPEKNLNNQQLGDRAKAQVLEVCFLHKKTPHVFFSSIHRCLSQHRFGLNDFESDGLGTRGVGWWGPYFVPASTSRCRCCC